MEWMSAVLFSLPVGVARRLSDFMGVSIKGSQSDKKEPLRVPLKRTIWPTGLSQDFIKLNDSSGMQTILEV